jgi:hypothetical protein
MLEIQSLHLCLSNVYNLFILRDAWPIWSCFYHYFSHFLLTTHSLLFWVLFAIFRMYQLFLQESLNCHHSAQLCLWVLGCGEDTGPPCASGLLAAEDTARCSRSQGPHTAGMWTQGQEEAGVEFTWVDMLVLWQMALFQGWQMLLTPWPRLLMGTHDISTTSLLMMTWTPGWSSISQFSPLRSIPSPGPSHSTLGEGVITHDHS